MKLLVLAAPGEPQDKLHHGAVQTLHLHRDAVATDGQPQREPSIAGSERPP